MNTKKNKKVKNSTQKCYNREKKDNISIVDTHLHLRPFNGPAMSLKKITNILHKSGVLYAEGEGIGQKIMNNPKCYYYLDCPSSSVKPSIENDILNAEALKKASTKDLHGVNIHLSMTFPDLSKPETILKNIKFLERKYPGMFKWMGEVNLVKQALFENKHKPVPIDVIKKWRPFMRHLEKKHMPLSIHSDLGNNNEPYKYLPLILKVLELYPKNKIVWMHLGLSKELTNIDSKEHTELLDKLLEEHPNLYFDISWSVLYKQKFYDEKERIYYVNLINKWPKRFLPGTDYIAGINNTYSNYKYDLKETSNILKYVNDEAFRRIALGQNYFELLRVPFHAPEVC
jgi:predicted TIM-barrel fold metal-dependent hydrolase